MQGFVRHSHWAGLCAIAVLTVAGLSHAYAEDRDIIHRRLPPPLPTCATATQVIRFALDRHVTIHEITPEIETLAHASLERVVLVKEGIYLKSEIAAIKGYAAPQTIALDVKRRECKNIDGLSQIRNTALDRLQKMFPSQAAALIALRSYRPNKKLLAKLSETYPETEEELREQALNSMRQEARNVWGTAPPVMCHIFAAKHWWNELEREAKLKDEWA